MRPLFETTEMPSPARGPHFAEFSQVSVADERRLQLLKGCLLHAFPAGAPGAGRQDAFRHYRITVSR